MLVETPELMREEINAAIELRRMHTEVSTELIKLYAANYYRADWNTEEPVPENSYWEYVANVLPTLVYANPRVRMKSRRPVAQAELVKAMQHGLNRWVRDVGLSQTLTLIAMDMLFDFGVALTTLQPIPGYSGWRGMKPLRPQVHRISPRRFFMDPQASSPELARFMGHFWVRDREDLLARRNPDGRPTYNRQMLERIGDSRGDDSLIRGTYGDSDHSSRRGSVRRDQVAGFEVYVPERRKIYTLGAYGGGEGVYEDWLREPRDAYSHDSGPYSLFGVYVVPDQVYPLSPLAATGEQIEELNAHAAAASREAARAKSLTLVESSNESVAKAITEGFDGHVYKVNGLTGAYQEVNLGGNHPDRIPYLQLLRERQDRHSGVSEVQRGNAGADATATASAIAQEAHDSRTRFMRLRFRENVHTVLDAAGFFLFDSPSVMFPVPIQTRSGEIDGTFVGGVNGETVDRDPAQADARYGDLELEIEIHTMEYQSEALARQQAQNNIALLSELAAQMPAMPWVAWRELLDLLGEAQNQPDYGRFVNFEMLEQLHQLTIARMEEAVPLEDPTSVIQGFKSNTSPTQPSTAARPAQGRGLSSILGGIQRQVGAA